VSVGLRSPAFRRGDLRRHGVGHGRASVSPDAEAQWRSSTRGAVRSRKRNSGASIGAQRRVGADPRPEMSRLSPSRAVRPWVRAPYKQKTSSEAVVGHLVWSGVWCEVQVERSCDMLAISTTSLTLVAEAAPIERHMGSRSFAWSGAPGCVGASCCRPTMGNRRVRFLFLARGRQRFGGWREDFAAPSSLSSPSTSRGRRTRALAVGDHSWRMYQVGYPQQVTSSPAIGTPERLDASAVALPAGHDESAFRCRTPWSVTSSPVDAVPSCSDTALERAAGEMARSLGPMPR